MTEYFCINHEFDECWESVKSKDDMCSDCAEKAYDNYLESYYGGSSPITLKEQIEVAIKQKEGKV